jgi:hypothetical protein
MVFNGKVESDFLKLVRVEDSDKSNLINFEATDFQSLKDSLINYIKTVYPLDYTYFAESDFGIMLVELVAYMGHVLSYKADYLANENYLKTARSRNNVKKLLELIGIRIKGPIAAATDATITLATNPGWASESSLVITPQNRVVSITSPEDGLPMTYTLYKVSQNGDIDLSNSEGNVIIYNSEKASNTLVSSLVLLEGSLVVETGSFADTESLKSITLQRSPVIEGSVQAFVTGQSSTSGQYRQVENLFFASGGDDKVFQIVSDDQYAARVVFGDNNLGKVPSIGDSYRILYRVGGGTRGNISRGVLNAKINTTFYSTPVTIPLAATQATIQNTSKGTGGADAETIEHAKKYGPLTFRSLNRLVTLLDYKAFVNSFISSYGSVGKATATTRRAYSSANIIDVYVLEKSNNIQLRKATPEYKRQIAEAISEKKMMTDEVIIVDGLIRTIDLIVTLRLDKKYQVSEETIKAKVRTKILEFFSVDNTDFGKEFIPQELLYKIFETEEVRFATIDNIFDSIKLNFNEILQINNFTINVAYV